MFSKLLCIVNISCYKKEQLKLHRSLLGVKGGSKTALGTALSPTFNCNAKLIFLDQISGKSTTDSTKLLENEHKSIKQGGILSPVLFNIYMDKLSIALNCYWWQNGWSAA